MAVLVVGATGALGLRVCQRLIREGRDVIAVHRRAAPPQLETLKAMGCETHRRNLNTPGSIDDLAHRADRIVFTPILTLSAPALNSLTAPQLKKAVLFSSNNVTLEAPCALYEDLRRHEAGLATLGTPLAILRPTMIYGYPGDGNLSRIISTAARWPVLPMAGRGGAKCQPIHVDDLANLAVTALFDPQITGTFTAAGPEPVTTRTLMDEINRATGRRRPVLPVPVWALKLASSLRPLPLDAQQLARANSDRVQGVIPGIPGWRPRVSLREGLSGLARALDAETSAPHIQPVASDTRGGIHVRPAGRPVRHR